LDDGFRLHPSFLCKLT